jgi:cell division protein FtsI/penicillin-binding protein 2
MLSSRGRTGAAVVAASAVVLATLTACSDPDPEPDGVAAAVAAQLTAGELDATTVADPGAATEQLASVLGALADLPREVVVGDIDQPEPEDDAAPTADAALTWTYDMGEGSAPLVVASTVRLEMVGDEDPSWVAAWAPAVVHPDASADSTFEISREQADRADILGYNDQDIVTRRPIMRLGIDKTRVPEEQDHEAAARELGEALELDDVDGYVQRVVDAGASAYVVALTIRAAQSQEYGVDDLRQIDGVLVQDDRAFLAPTASFARPVLGNVGEATAEIIEQSEGSIQQGWLVGTSGLQRAYDDQLGGTPGFEVTLTGTSSGDLDLYRSLPVDGQDLSTSLDAGLQESAESILADEPSASAIVALEATTGAVLAAASGPGGEGFSTATLGQYPPGSTFKIVTALALLRSGLTPDSEVECTPTVTVDGWEFENYPGYPTSSVGTIPLREAIAQSCNTALIAQHAQVSPEELADAAASLGVGAAMPDDVAWPFAYFPGTVPTDVDGTAHAAAFIGQGQVTTSPLAMAGVAASVAAGTTITPVLVTSEKHRAPLPPATALLPEEAQALQEMMRGVVESGTSTFLQDVPGPPVAAKSGTAQYGSGDPLPTHAWMIAFQGDLAVAVFVEDGDYGTSTAGPLLEEFLRSAEGTSWTGESE